MEFSVDRNIALKRLLNVGSVVDFNSNMQHQIHFNGKWIMHTTKTSIFKGKLSWEASCDVTLIRSMLMG